VLEVPDGVELVITEGAKVGSILGISVVEVLGMVEDVIEGSILG